MPCRRSPPPWSVEEQDACFCVRDHDGQQLAYAYFEDEPGRRSATKVLTKDEARTGYRSLGSFRRCPLPLKPCSFNAFSKPSFVGLLLAFLELAIMARDDAVTKPHIGRRLGFSQQLKFRS